MYSACHTRPPKDTPASAAQPSGKRSHQPRIPISLFEKPLPLQRLCGYPLQQVGVYLIMYEQVDRDIRIHLLESLHLGFVLSPLKPANIMRRRIGRPGDLA